MGHSEVTDTRKGWKDSGECGVIRLQKLAPSAGSRTTVETSWLQLESWTDVAAASDACGSRARRNKSLMSPLGIMLESALRLH